MGKYFGTDGFRGEANLTLTNSHAYNIGRFLGWHFSKGERQAKIVIGKDTRRSSYMLEYALATGISASGGKPYMLHVIPTSGVAYALRTEEFDCGIMISASHNLYFDNGIKLFDSSGEKMQQQLIDKIENYLNNCTDEQSKLPLAMREKIGKVEDFSAGRNRYVAFLLSVAKRSLKGLKVGLDTANGASYCLAKNVFEALGAKVFVINNTPDGTNINVNCGSTHTNALQKLVLEQRLDIGFAFDGDADRCLAVDERGNLVDGDCILYLCAKDLLDKGSLDGNKVVVTVMSNAGLLEQFKKMKINCLVTDVGDKNVYRQMVKKNCLLGGEQSGHIIFRKYATTGDGILTAIVLAQLVQEKKCSLSTLLAPLLLFPQRLINIVVFDKERVLKSRNVQNAILKAQQDIESFGGRVLVRASGTENIIRIMTACNSQSICEEIEERISKSILQANRRVIADRGEMEK